MSPLTSCTLVSVVNLIVLYCGLYTSFIRRASRHVLLGKFLLSISRPQGNDNDQGASRQWTGGMEANSFIAFVKYMYMYQAWCGPYHQSPIHRSNRLHPRRTCVFYRHDGPWCEHGGRKGVSARTREPLQWHSAQLCRARQALYAHAFGLKSVRLFW